jgi:hypothetical protein
VWGEVEAEGVLVDGLEGVPVVGEERVAVGAGLVDRELRVGHLRVSV